MKRIIAFLVLVLVSMPLLAAPKPSFSKERLARVDRVLKQLVDDNKLAGGVALVLQDGKPVYENVFGWRDKEAGQKMQRDTIFRIASQTKAITSAAALILLEEGKLQLADPVSRYIPSFTKTTVRDDKGKEVPAKRPITIFDLLTHTSGISYGGQPAIAASYREKNLNPLTTSGEWTLALVSSDETICTAMDRLGTLPFISQPGEAFVYGYNIDVLGCIIERVSGKTLDKFIDERILKPLKMKDTEFFLSRSKVDRLAVVYTHDAHDKTVRAPVGPTGQGPFVDGPKKAFSGGGGLLSTAHDYARFLEMIRQGGELEGVRILAPRTVALMRTNQIGSIYGTPGLGFGLGFEVTEKLGAKGLDEAGAFGWGGAYGSVYRVDPKARLTLVFMIQQLPWAKASDIRALYATMIYQALIEPAN